MRRTSLLCIILTLVLTLAACRGRSAGLDDVVVEINVGPYPPEVGPATVAVTLAATDGSMLEKAKIEVEASMEHAGMVPVIAQASEVEPGRYRASIEFTMAGDWFILIRATLPDGRTGEWKRDVPAVLWVTP